MTNPHKSRELVDRRIPSFGTSNVVPGGKKVGRIQADRQAARLVDTIEDLGQVLDPVPQTTPLPRGVLESDSYLRSFRRGQHLVQAGNDLADSGLVARPKMCAGVQHQKRQIENRGKFYLLDQRSERDVPVRGSTGREIDQVPGVPKHREQFAFPQLIAIQAEVGFGRRFAEPLHIIFDEDLADLYTEVGRKPDDRGCSQVTGEIGITNVYSPMVPASANPLDKVSAGLMDMAQNRIYADPVLLGKYPDLIRAATFFSSFSPSSEDMALISQPLDYYGLNYYMPTRVASGPGDGPVPEGMAAAMGDDLSGTAPGSPFHIATFPDTETTAYGWPIKPEYMSVALAEMSERYPDLPPVYITEGGASFEDLEIRDASGRLIIPDERRVRYLADHIATAIEATSPGGAAEKIDLRGYYVWSLLDNFEWSGGYKQQFGLLHVDRETQVRTPKASFYWLQEVLASRSQDAFPKAPAGADLAGTPDVEEPADASDVEDLTDTPDVERPQPVA